jgi:hypothetical protein
MPPPRLLCAGPDSALLETRCAVLRYSGYEVQAATLEKAETFLRDEVYDLLIISALLTDQEETRMLAAARKTPAYVLDGLTLADDLLDQVKYRLPPISSRVINHRIDLWATSAIGTLSRQTIDARIRRLNTQHYEAPLRRLASWLRSSRFSARRSRFSIRNSWRDWSSVPRSD